MNPTHYFPALPSPIPPSQQNALHLLLKPQEHLLVLKKIETFMVGFQAVQHFNRDLKFCAKKLKEKIIYLSKLQDHRMLLLNLLFKHVLPNELGSKFFEIAKSQVELESIYYKNTLDAADLSLKYLQRITPLPIQDLTPSDPLYYTLYDPHTTPTASSTSHATPNTGGSELLSPIPPEGKNALSDIDIFMSKIKAITCFDDRLFFFANQLPQHVVCSTKLQECKLHMRSILDCNTQDSLRSDLIAIAQSQKELESLYYQKTVRIIAKALKHLECLPCKQESVDLPFGERDLNFEQKIALPKFAKKEEWEALELRILVHMHALRLQNPNASFEELVEMTCSIKKEDFEWESTLRMFRILCGTQYRADGCTKKQMEQIRQIHLSNPLEFENLLALVKYWIPLSFNIKQAIEHLKNNIKIDQNPLNHYTATTLYSLACGIVIKKDLKLT